MHDVYLQEFMKYKQVSVERTFKTSVIWLFTSLNYVQGSEYVHERAIYVQTKMDVHRRVGTYTIREAHWFKSSFTGNNAPLNTNGIQCICTDETETTDQSLSVKGICIMYR